MEPILFLDIEFNPKTKRIQEIGLVKGRNEYKGKDLSRIRHFLPGVKWICGHNIVAHDLPELKNGGVADTLSGLPAIDTLLLSPLLRPDLKRHHLSKDYFVTSLSKPDPVYDAALSRDLLFDLAEIWSRLPEGERSTFRTLLKDQAGFRGFFEWMDWRRGGGTEGSPAGRDFADISTRFRGEICSNADLHSLGGSSPIELAYVLALVKTDEPKIFTPSWVLGSFPDIQSVFDELRTRRCTDSGCSYCASRLNPVKGLNEFFGYPGFRSFEGDEGMPLQEKVVHAALRDESFLAIFPTGGGKSLTFQLPALMRGKAKGALTVIISPLVSLMKDQVDVLFNRFHRNEAVALNGMLSPPERQEAIDRIEEGTASLVYLSPEGLRSATILRLLTRRIIDRFVIDEAHCFSAWGQDFRVDYAFIGPFIKMLQDRKMDKRRIPVSCFTATARPQVVQDIKDYFLQELGIEMKEFITRQRRENLEFQVTSVKTEEEKFDRLVRLLGEKGGPSIVYVTLTKTTEALAKKLRAFHIRAGYYHGQMETALKKRQQEQFMNNQLDVIVATSAFGMGVDKENVKLVVHYQISSSLENYIQEAGRAGRNKEIDAECVVLFDQTDLDEHFNILQGGRISQKEIQQIWKGIQKFKSEKITKSALEIARNAGWEEDVKDTETKVRTAINALENAGYVKRFLNAPKLYADSILIDNYEEGWAEIKKNASSFRGLEVDAGRVLKAIMGQSRRAGETKVDYLADGLGLRGEKVVTIINLLKEIEVLGNMKDLEVDVNLVKSKYGSREIAKRFLELEERLFQWVCTDVEPGMRKSISLRELNDQIAKEFPKTDMSGIRRLLQFWELQGKVKVKRTQRSEFVYEVAFRVSAQAFQDYLERKRELCRNLTKELTALAHNVDADHQNADSGKTVGVEFSTVLLKKKIESASLFQQPIDLRFFERALLFLNHVGAIELKRGFLVFFNRLQLSVTERNSRKQFTIEDYAKMKLHYQQRIEQIHIVGEYAKRMLRDYKNALVFVSDYFELEYQSFLSKYIPKHRREEIKRAMTPETFRRIFAHLSPMQLAPVKDAKAEEIVVAAGPGSGKTMVLVHKMASLILMEDIHPRQLLVLTFSRPAAREFKERLIDLVGGIGRRVHIFTFHGYAFRLLGKMGDLRKVENVIQKATSSVLKEEVLMEMVAGKNVIMLDEFQDVSKLEFDFLAAIKEKAGDPRVIAAGDDDQNIYEFRGSSVAYMREMAESERAQAYFLTDNYRSGRNIVEFSNAFLNLLPQSRLKSGEVLNSKNPVEDRVKIYQYPVGGLVEAFCQSISSQDLKGTTGVLTHTNEEAYFVASRLRSLGIPVTLVASSKEFRLQNLAELKAFTHRILPQNKPSDSGWISNEDWDKAKSELSRHYGASKDWPLALRVIDTFDKEKNYKFRVDWLEFIRNATIEDFYGEEKGRVFVSTMHKIKGKQFDKVYLMLDHFSIKDHASLRVVYVAITRPRQYLEIHTHLPIFDRLEAPGLLWEKAETPKSILPLFSIQCSLSDVVLSHFHQPDIRNRANALLAGDPLNFTHGDKFHRGLLPGERNEMAVCFSKKFKEKLDGYFSRGYRVKDLMVGHIVHWWDSNEEVEVKVVLPELTLEKQSRS